ncbi:MAG: hypothetical protein QOD07_2208 [Frankiaceae bacterium]|nr:hypothetical protein [Frankiaceae bacterium]
MRRALLAVALLFVAFPAASSSATTYYDYWGYWHKPPRKTAWEYSKVGPSGYRLVEGSQVEGWRFAVGTASSSDPKPRPTDVSYDHYCAGKNTSSTYRVLLVVDYGTQSGAPNGPVYSCYGFDSAVTGFDVLTQQHSERDSGGLICAIDGYPKSGCGEVVSSPSPKPTRTTTTATASPAAHRAVGPKPSSAGPSTPAPIASATSHHSATTPAATTTAASAAPTASPSPSDSTAVVAKQFVPPRSRGGVPYGFVAACVFVVAVAGAVFWQRRRRAG